mmetsp:Transcript_41789/g.100330  ORF Transcript_41789/g.100330 Transcript_41789/m.100330 type:complete len:207 (+) Transcript_41789:516-1136(+)
MWRVAAQMTFMLAYNQRSAVVGMGPNRNSESPPVFSFCSCRFFKTDTTFASRSSRNCSSVRSLTIRRASCWAFRKNHQDRGHGLDLLITGPVKSSKHDVANSRALVISPNSLATNPAYGDTMETSWPACLALSSRSLHPWNTFSSADPPNATPSTKAAGSCPRAADEGNGDGAISTARYVNRAYSFNTMVSGHRHTSCLSAPAVAW